MLLKFAPVIASVAMMLHTSMLLMGYDTILADYTFSLPFFPWLVCVVWSKAFGFCAMHRHFITYPMIGTYCIFYQADYGFGAYLEIARIIYLCVGLVLLSIFATKSVNNKCKSYAKYYKSCIAADNR